MDIELGIQNVARTVTFSTEQSADEVNNVIAEAVENGKTINLTDDKGRRIVVPAGSLGYAIIGSETKHAVGFGNTLIVTCKRVGHVPNEKDVGPYQVQTPFFILDSCIRFTLGNSISGFHAACELPTRPIKSAPRCRISRTVSSSVRFSPRPFGLPLPCQSEPPVTSRSCRAAIVSNRSRCSGGLPRCHTSKPSKPSAIIASSCSSDSSRRCVADRPHARRPPHRPPP